MHFTTAPGKRKANIYKLLGLWAVVVAFVTLTPTNAVPLTSWYCLSCIDQYVLDVVLNIAIFIPLGIMLSRISVPPSWAVLLAFAITVGIEVVQIVVPGRHPSLLDILSNSGGAVTGIVLMSIDWSRAAPRRAVAVALLSVTLMHFPLVPWMLAPISTGRDAMIGLVGHTFPGYVPFEGELLTAEFEQQPIPYGYFPDSLPVRQLFDVGTFTVRTVSFDTPPAVGRALVTAVADGDRFLLELSQQECAVSLRIRRRATRFGMGTPGIGLDIPCPVWRDTLTLIVRATTNGLSLDAVAPGFHAGTTTPRSPALGWALGSPFTLDYRGTGLWSGLWLLLLSFTVMALWTWAFGPRWSNWLVAVTLPAVFVGTIMAFSLDTGIATGAILLISGSVAGSAVGGRIGANR